MRMFNQHKIINVCAHKWARIHKKKRIKRKDTVYNENVHIIGIIIILASLSYIYDEYNECTVDDTNQYLY